MFLFLLEYWNSQVIKSHIYAIRRTPRKKQNSMSLIRLACLRTENPAGNNTFFNI